MLEGQRLRMRMSVQSELDAEGAISIQFQTTLEGLRIEGRSMTEWIPIKAVSLFATRAMESLHVTIINLGLFCHYCLQISLQVYAVL